MRLNITWCIPLALPNITELTEPIQWMGNSDLWLWDLNVCDPSDIGYIFQLS